MRSALNVKNFLNMIALSNKLAMHCVVKVNGFS